MKAVLAIISAFFHYSVVLCTNEFRQQTDICIDYQCGAITFAHKLVQKYLEEPIEDLEKQGLFLMPYKGLLYSDHSGYILWPIKEFPDSHFIVIDKNKQVIDLIVRTSDYNFVKCKKHDPSLPDNSVSLFENTNGYQCGHVFFSDKKIEESRELAVKKMGLPGLKYPKLIRNPLYRTDQNHMIWPILKVNQVYHTGTENGGPFYIVIDQTAKLIDVVTRASSRDFIKCLRERKIKSAPSNDPMSQLFAPPPISGFNCGKVFFDDDYINRVVDVAMEKERIKNGRNIYSANNYGGNKFPPGTILWPLSINRKLYVKGGTGIYRVVISQNFEVRGVVTMVGDRVIQCERFTLKGKKNHDTNNYSCLEEDFSHEELRSAADAACKSRNSVNKAYPAVYSGPGFDMEGPYLTFPVIKYGKFKKVPGKFRVVINTKCEVVGALFRHKEKLYKCRKIVDGIIPILRPNESEPPIKENQFQKKL